MGGWVGGREGGCDVMTPKLPPHVTHAMSRNQKPFAADIGWDDSGISFSEFFGPRTLTYVFWGGWFLNHVLCRF